MGNLTMSYDKEKYMPVIDVDSIEATPLQAGEGATMQMIISPKMAPHFAMRKFTIAPGGFMPNHTNSVEHEQYVLEGCASVGIGNEVFEAKAGDAVYVPAGIPHWYRVKGAAPYVFLCMVPNLEDEIRVIG